jgi:CYTH domain-containing protein
MSSQRIGKYACLEIERKYLLRELPADLNTQNSYWQITDHYIINTRLRLRRMVSPATNQVIFKLGQKYRTAAQGHSQTTMTNMYLTEAEYLCLARLEAAQLLKKRYDYSYQGRRYGIDLFEGHLAGLILAEIEAETVDELDQLPVPSFALAEVTGDPFFEGGALVLIDPKEFQTSLTERLKAASGWL